MSGVDDLARALARPHGEDVGRAQGVIRAWNTDTLSNVIDYDGLLIPDVPVRAGIDALAFEPGMPVALELWFPGGKVGERGIGTPVIAGAAITPGAGAAERVVAALRSNLVKQLSVGVFAERVHGAAAAGNTGFISSDTYVSHVDGPTVPNVPVSAAGVAIVTVTGEISGTVGTSQNDCDGRMSFAISGATTVDAVDDNSAAREQSMTNHGSIIAGLVVRISAQTVITGLNEGLHDFEAMYRNPHGGAPNPSFIRRSISVIAL